MRARAPRVGAARSAGVQPCARVVVANCRRRPVRCAAAGAPDDPYAALDRTPKTLTLRIGESEVTVETGRIGRQANGAVMVTEGETVIYATICAGRDVTADGGFVPLTVNYQERYSAVGRTAGGYRKRDGGVRENETLIGRLVDRPLRPMIPKGWAYDTQILEWVLSYDGERSTDALAITAASAAAAISDVPLKKPIAGVRVGLLPGETEPLINPTCEQMERSRLDLVLAGTEDAVMMIEGFGDFLTVEEMLYAVEKGHEAVANACRDIEAWAKEVGRVKNEAAVLVAPEGVDDAVRALVGAELAEAMAISVKQTRGAAVEGIRARAIESLAGGDDAKFTVRTLDSTSRSKFAFCSSFPSPPARACSGLSDRPFPNRHSSRSTKGPRRSIRGSRRRRTAQLRARRSTTREYLERTLGPPRGRTRALPTSSLCTYATAAILLRPLARDPYPPGVRSTFTTSPRPVESLARKPALSSL